MKQKICGAILLVSSLLILGIIRGVDDGAPITNALWCIPLLCIVFISAYVGGFFNDCE